MADATAIFQVTDWRIVHTPCKAQGFTHGGFTGGILGLREPLLVYVHSLVWTKVNVSECFHQWALPWKKEQIGIMSGVLYTFMFLAHSKGFYWVGKEENPKACICAPL